MNNTNLRHPHIDALLKKVLQFFLYAFALSMPFSIAATQISLGIALLIWLCRIVITRGIKFKSYNLEWAFLAFVAAELISFLFSTNMPQNFVYLKRLLLIPIVYLVATSIEDEKQFQRIVWIFTSAVTLYSLLGIISWFQTPELRVRHIQTTMTAGGITMIGGLACLALFSALKDFTKKAIYFFFAIVNAACLVLTSTRGSWLGFFFGVILIFFYSNRKLLISIPVIIIAFYIFSPAAFKHRITGFFDPDMGTNSKRLLWWSVGWEIFKDHPVVGIGDVGTAQIYKKYAPPGTTELAGHMHSNYIHIAVTLGIIGFLAFMYMIIAVFKSLYQLLSKTIPVGGFAFSWALASLAIFLAFNINGFFEWNFGDAEIITMVWFTIGLSLAIMALLNETNVRVRNEL